MLLEVLYSLIIAQIKNYTCVLHINFTFFSDPPSLCVMLFLSTFLLFSKPLTPLKTPYLREQSIVCYNNR